MIDGGYDDDDDVNGVLSVDSGTGASPFLEFPDNAMSAWSDAAIYNPMTFQTTLTDRQQLWNPDELVGHFIQANFNDPRMFVVLSNTETSVTVWGNLTRMGSCQEPNIYIHDRIRAKSEEECMAQANTTWTNLLAPTAPFTSYAIFDLRLAENSVCIDAGNNNAIMSRDGDGDGLITSGACSIPAHTDRASCEWLGRGTWTANDECAADDVLCLDEGLSTDLLGHNRFVDGDNNGLATVDLGAYELQEQ
jgi:hypothetical protein